MPPWVIESKMLKLDVMSSTTRASNVLLGQWPTQGNPGRTNASAVRSVQNGTSRRAIYAHGTMSRLSGGIQSGL